MGARAVAVRAPRAGRRMVKTASSSSGRFESRASASMTSRAREMEQTLEVQAEGEGVEDEMREIAVDARAPRVRRDRGEDGVERAQAEISVARRAVRHPRGWGG